MRRSLASCTAGLVIIGLLAVGCSNDPTQTVSAAVTTTAIANTTTVHSAAATPSSSTPQFAEVTTTSDIAWGSAVNQAGVTVALAADSYEPTGDTSTARPAVVWIHGGGFAAGERTSPEIIDEATEMARHGYFGFSIDYRLSPIGCGRVDGECVRAITQATEDGLAAVRYLRSNAAKFRIDPDRIAIAGSSAGAITALNVAYASDPTAPVRAAISISGGALPPGAIGAGDAPTLMFHSKDDHTVPYAWATRTADAAHAAGLTADLVAWGGDGHVPYVEHRREILDRTAQFLDEHDR